ncbi:MAG: T9SS type A sorting domain-containing protein [Bacteroidia bacterium]|nr:T9SS type A sorting domain-containing protein [Bacteroidia bacterium]
MKSTIKIISTVFLAGVFSLSQGQNLQPCGHDLVIKKIEENNPAYRTNRDIWYNTALQLFDKNSAQRRINRDTLFYTIPVVFHVIYNNAQENLADPYIISQLATLNACFRRLNSDTTKTRSRFMPVASDTRIQFVLASTDPSGNPTNGITRTQTSVTEWGNIQQLNDNMKFTSKGGQDGWDPSKYMNIWICDLRDPTYGEVLYGFAYPPDGAPNWQNSTQPVNSPFSGVVLHYKIVGINNPLANSNYKQGKTAVHEVGHYLGLRHIWGDGTGQSGFNNCAQSDGIDDTPFSSSPTGLCDTMKNSCIEQANDQPDMIENYMDYSPNTCQNMYTRKQSVIMQYVLNRFRTDLSTRTIAIDTVSDKEGPAAITMFPNPFRNSFNISVLNAKGSKFYCDIYDMLGRKTKKTIEIQTDIDYPVNTEYLAEGFYVVEIFNEGRSEMVRMKIIKQ